MQIQSVSKRVW